LTKFLDCENVEKTKKVKKKEKSENQEKPSRNESETDLKKDTKS